MTTKAEKRYTSGDIEQLLAARYVTNEYALFFNVPNETGGLPARRADALAVNLWRSRGHELIGFEIKVDRRDWLRELKDPAKADVICRYCHRWYIVAPEGIVDVAELPETWGLLVPHGKGLRVAKNPPALTPEPLSLPFFASLCRVAQSTLTENAKIEEAYRRGRQESHDGGYKLGKEHAESSLKRDLDWRTRERDQARQAIAKFEESAGVRLDQFNADKVGRAVKLVLDGDFPRYASHLQQMHSTLATSAAFLEQQVAEATAILASEDE